MSKNTILAEELTALDRSIKRVRWGVLIAMIVVLGSYSYWFGIIRHGALGDADDWGALGDYFGGLLNPLIAFLALYWLTKSVRVQKEELTATRGALESAGIMQNQQVRLAALTALTSSVMTELRFNQESLMFIGSQLSGTSYSSIRDMRGNVLQPEKAVDFMKDIHDKILKRIADQHKYEREIVEILISTKP